MKFLTNKEFLLTMDEENLNEILSSNISYLDEAEARSIECVKEYLRQRYDIEHELRPIVDFSINTVYDDYQRIRLTYNEDNNSFGTTFNIQLIDSNIIEGDEIILVKIPNTCADEKEVKYVFSTYPDTELTYYINNPSYNASCGLITGIDGSYKSNNIINYYNSTYSGDTISTIDFTTKTVDEIYDIVGNINHFDQYTKSNQSRDFNSDDRNFSLKQIIMDLTRYELFQRVAPRQLNQIVADRYDRAINKLEKASKGEIQMNLKEIPSSIEWQNNLSVRYGHSIVSRNWKY